MSADPQAPNLVDVLRAHGLGDWYRSGRVTRCCCGADISSSGIEQHQAAAIAAAVPGEGPIVIASDGTLSRLDDDLFGETEHVAQFGPTGWTLQHPLACRPDLLACSMNALMDDQAEGLHAQIGDGRFRISVDDGVLAAGLVISDGGAE